MSMLHITNGDSAAETLRESSVPGTVSAWGDVLWEGPVPSDVDDTTFREARARFHAGEHFSYEQCIAMSEGWDRALASSDEYDEVVLWFEHDLHDQIILVYLLNWFANRSTRKHQLSLICINAFPGVEPFYGLGQLNANQMASLLDTRTPVTQEQIALGQSTWRAFTADNPQEIERVLEHSTSALQFLGASLQRLLQEFPDSVNGLPRTERTILQLLQERGALTFAELFPEYMRREDAPFMGDLSVWTRIENLANGARPLIAIEKANGAKGFGKNRLSITEQGRRVLNGDVDWMSFATFDRWIGGTHLIAPNIAWRWDNAKEKLVA